MQMAAKKPGRAESGETAEGTEATTANVADSANGAEGAQPALGRKTGSPAKKSGSAAGGASAAAPPAGGGADGHSAASAGATGGAQARTRTPRKPAGATGDTEGGTGGSTRGRKSASAGAAKTTSKRAGATKGGKSQGADAGGGSDLQRNLRAFVDHHPQGWGHHDWEGLLHHLRESGVDTSDEGRIGVELEKERVVRALENSGVSGLGGSKARSLADRFGTIRELHQASVDDIAGMKGINRSQAEKIREALRR
jgi:hypothetical protein